MTYKYKNQLRSQAVKHKIITIENAVSHYVITYL